MEKSILFNTEMVKAILEDGKTVTRRVIKPQPNQPTPLGFVSHSTDDKNVGCFGWGQDKYGGICDYRKPPYRPGDILYVRETFANTWTPAGDDIGFIYKADGKPKNFPYWGNAKQCKDEVWIPSIHMPKEAARIFLKVTDVRVERLQDINCPEAKKEGVLADESIREDGRFLTEKGNFIEIWNSTIKKSELDKYGWEANPWVFVIEFERISKEEHMKSKSYEKMQNFIKKNEYTYEVESILKSYQEYWMKGYYTSYTMTHCIENLKDEIEILISE